MTATATETPVRPRRDRPGARVRSDDAELELAPSIDRTADAEPRLGVEPIEPFPLLTTTEGAEIEARGSVSVDHWERVYRGLRIDAQSCARSMSSSPLVGTEKAWTDIVDRSLDDYRSGRSLMEHLGADRLIDPALTGMLLAIRRGLIEEIHSPSMADFVLIDTAVIAFANAMRLQSIVGNTALIIESELFGQPTLRGGRPGDRHNLAVGQHVERLRETLVPLVEKFNRMGNEAIGAIRRQREAPSALVERARPLEIRVMSAASPGQ
jgi:hypothetical protein